MDISKLQKVLSDGWIATYKECCGLYYIYWVNGDYEFSDYEFKPITVEQEAQDIVDKLNRKIF